MRCGLQGSYSSLHLPHGKRIGEYRHFGQQCRKHQVHPMCKMSAFKFRQLIYVWLNATFMVLKDDISGMIKKWYGKICSMISKMER